MPTREELIRMGARPVTPTSDERRATPRYSREELLRMGAKPVQSARTAPPEAPPEAPHEAPEEQDGIIKTIIKDPLKQLLRVGTRAGEALAGLGVFGKTVQRGAEQISQKPIEYNVPVLGKIKIEPVKTGVSGVKQAVGESLEAGSYLVGGGAAKEVGKQVGKQAVRKIAGRAALESGKGGVVYGAGVGLQKDEDAKGVFKEAAIGGGLGLVGGATLGAGGALIGKAVGRALAPKSVKMANELDKAENIFRESLRMPARAVKKEQKGRLYAERYGEEERNIPRFIVENDLIPRTNELPDRSVWDTTEARRKAVEGIDAFDDLLKESLERAGKGAKKYDLLQMRNNAAAGVKSSSALLKEQTRAKIIDAFDAEIASRGRYVDDLAVLEIKRGLYALGKYDTMPDSAAGYRKAGEFLMRKMEEMYEGELDIRAINRVIGDYLEADEFLKNIHGQTIAGGSPMSQKLAGLAGAIVGRASGVPIAGEIIGFKAGQETHKFLTSPERRLGRFRGRFEGEGKPSSVFGKTKEQVRKIETERAGRKQLGGGAIPMGPGERRSFTGKELISQEEAERRYAEMRRSTEASRKTRERLTGKVPTARDFPVEESIIFRGKDGGYFTFNENTLAPQRITRQEGMELERAGYHIFPDSLSAKAAIIEARKSKVVVESGKPKGRIIEGQVVKETAIPVHKKEESALRPETFNMVIDQNDVQKAERKYAQQKSGFLPDEFTFEKEAGELKQPEGGEMALFERTGEMKNVIGKKGRTFEAKEAKEYPDVNVKQEIPANLSLQSNFKELVKTGKTVQFGRSYTGLDESGLPLRAAIYYPELFEAYPAAKNIRVKMIGRNEGKLGGFKIEERKMPNGEVRISPVIEIAHGLENPESTLKHEIQHFIQAKEHWPKGGSLESIRNPSVQYLMLLRMRDAVLKNKRALGAATVQDMDTMDRLIKKTRGFEPMTEAETVKIFGGGREFDKQARRIYEMLSGEVEARGTFAGKSRKDLLFLRRELDKEMREEAPEIGKSMNVALAEVINRETGLDISPNEIGKRTKSVFGAGRITRDEIKEILKPILKIIKDESRLEEMVDEVMESARSGKAIRPKNIFGK